jgi:adenylylsulfate kinase-like enzyme
MSKALFPVVWLTGNTGAGKTTLAVGLQELCETKEGHPLFRRLIVLDGDEMRASISTQETLTAEDRRTHNLRVARLASVLRLQGFLVVVAVIAPFAAVRREIDAICAPLWIYVKRSNLEGVNRPYEAPEAPHLVIDTDLLDIAAARQHGFDFLQGITAASGMARLAPHALPQA